jgi:RNA polymerase sigma-70 factor (ECF subfamily)
LINKLKKKDSKALNLIIEKYSSYAFTVARNIMGDYMSYEDIEETVSDSFVSLWNNSDRLSEEKPLRPYMSAIIRNNARNRLRNNRLNISIDEMTYEPVGNDDIPKLAENIEAVGLLYEAVEQFNNADKEIFIRYYFYGEKLDNIAVKTGLTLSNCKTKLCRTRKKIKQYLTERGYDYETK